MASKSVPPARRRLMRDYKKVQQDPPAGISAVPVDKDLMLWNAVMFGPDGTAWEGGSFKLTMQFSDDYPNKPPKVTFVTKMFHPNIYNDGSICLDILQSQWSEAARLYRDSRKEYDMRVKAVVEQSWEEGGEEEEEEEEEEESEKDEEEEKKE